MGETYISHNMTRCHGDRLMAGCLDGVSVQRGDSFSSWSIGVLLYFGSEKFLGSSCQFEGLGLNELTALLNNIFTDHRVACTARIPSIIARQENPGF